MGALISAIGAPCLLALWHDGGTLRAIHASSGLDEVFELPVMRVLPGAVLGTVGGLAGATITRWRSI